MPSVLEASWIGRRVVVRRVVGRGPDGGLQFGDVVGDLLSIGAAAATIETGRGAEKALTTIDLGHVAVAKIVEPSAAEMLTLQRIAAFGIRSIDTAQIGGWLLRCDPGELSRANSVRPLASPNLPMDDALAAVQRWYAERGKPAKFLNPTEARRLLDAELGERGWDHSIDVNVMAARLDTLDRDIIGALATDSIEIRLSTTPQASWCANYRGDRPTQATIDLLARHDCVQFAELVLDGRTVSIARGVVDEDWLGLSSIEVLPEYRRRGLASVVMAELLRWGQAQGAKRSYLEVSSDNTAAIAVYRRMGFWNHHEYRYRVAPAADTPVGPVWPTAAS